jgi:hypothetical protein
LRRAIAERRDKPHAWGSHDCALFAADLVNAQTGHDFAAGFRGRYSDEEGAWAILKALGHRDLADLVDTLLTRRTAMRPQRGDVVLHPGLKGDFLAIVWNGGIVAPGPDRLLLRPLRVPVVCWEVA